jgi:CheY-like chemotaxis protein
MNTQIERTPILVVDDNPTDVFFLEHRLHAAGILHPLQHVEDGIEAIRALERCNSEGANTPTLPWLMFLDLKMPRMDGFEVLTWLKDHGITDRTTVVVVSTSDEPKDIERATRLGAHRFLVKYPLPSQLAEVVALAQQRWVSHGSQSDTVSTSSN